MSYANVAHRHPRSAVPVGSTMGRFPIKKNNERPLKVPKPSGNEAVSWNDVLMEFISIRWLIYDDVCIASSESAWFLLKIRFSQRSKTPKKTRLVGSISLPTVRSWPENMRQWICERGFENQSWNQTSWILWIQWTQVAESNYATAIPIPTLLTLARWFSLHVTLQPTWQPKKALKNFVWLARPGSW